MKLENIINLIEPPISGEWGTDVSELSQNVAKIIRTTNFTNIGKIDYEKEVVLRDIDGKKIANKKLLCGDIIVEKSGGSPTQPVGRVVYFDLDTDENYLCNNFTSVLRPKNDKVHSKYLFWMLFYQHLSKKTLNFQNKTTGIINLKLDRYVKEIQIPLPPLDIQKKIADSLDKAQELIDKRKEQISALDKFLENLFLEMFGDPVSNIMGWEKVNLENVCTDIVDCPHSTPKHEDIATEYASIRTSEIRNGRIDWSSMKYVSYSQYQERVRRIVPIQGDIIYAREGSFGDAIIVPNNKKICLGQRVMLFRANNDTINYIFFWFQLRSSFVYNQALKKNTGTTVGHINVKDIKKFIIFLPPLDLQNQFASIVEKVEAEKIKLESSLTEMEDNFNSIMQRAFKGELF